MIADMNARSRARTLAALAFATLAVAGCLASHEVVTGAWSLVEVNGSLPAAEASISLLPDGTFTMRPGCNTGDGTYAIVGNRLEAEVMSLTMKSCGDAANAQEQTVVTVLEADPRFEIETGSGRLRLAGADGTVLLFEAP
jgi:heat shock protein HslJ